MQLKGTAENYKTKERRPVAVSIATLEKAAANGVDRCTGPCRCKVEPDGYCSKGWPSRMGALRII